MRSDKGNNTVIMKKEEYLNEMHKMLQNKDIYQLLNKDPTRRYEKLANNLITKLRKESIITEEIEKSMKSYNSVAPKIYGLRKKNKQSLALRPVVSCIRSPCYKLAQFLHHKLSSAMTNKFVFSVKNSFEFVEFIQKITLPEDYRLVSLDAISLFTNIPKKLVIRTINDDWNELKNVITIPKNILLEIIQFCFDSSHFQFDESFYQQLDGSSMGNPASPILANLVMNHVLKKIEGNLPFTVPFLKVYVDDIITEIPKDGIEVVLKTFNMINEKIQFTIEIEDNGTLPFLDVTVIRNEDGTISTNWYVKPTSSGRCINYYSNHSLSQKIEAIKGLLLRALTLSNKKF
ncbi:hypothetical protein M0804_013522 [Polistes exclamans]|nr:hypothetical protein M0804_013522 [Polistes exclamans]